MKYEPHDYQTYATNFIIEQEISAILLDMGLGKTVITLTALDELLFNHFVIGKVLVVAPLRVARDTWPQEISKWAHLSNLTYSVIVGSEAKRKAALAKAADIYIINRENVEWLVSRSGTTTLFDMIVIDELSSFKNARSKRFQNLLRIRPNASRIVGLTGTPAGNGLMDLWAEFRMLDYGKRLGRFITHYRNTYFMPDKRNGNIIYTYKPLPGAKQAIFNEISDITISMKAKDHIKMPEIIYTNYEVHLSEAEAEMYDELADTFTVELNDGPITAANAAVLTGKLLQVANGAIYDEARVVTQLHQRKLEALEDLLEAANGKPTLVAYWFQHDLNRIKKVLNERGVVFDELKSSASINAWNASELEVGLIHPGSAGHGLNLQMGGSTIVWFGLTWSLELYQQTNARLWRQGQNADTVVVMHIVAKDTIDELVLKVLKGKDTLQNALLQAVKAEVGGQQ